MGRWLESIRPSAKHFRRPTSQTIRVNSEEDVAHLGESMSRDMAQLFGAESLLSDGSSDHWTPGNQVRALAREAGLHARILSENIDEPEERACAQQLLQRAYEDKLVALIIRDNNFKQFTSTLERGSSRVPGVNHSSTAANCAGADAYVV